MRYNNPLAGIFESSYREEKLDKLGDPLSKMASHIDWESFRPSLASHFPSRKSSKGGRPRMDPVMMLKVLILQKL
ncbi:MAG: IS5 family transposase [Limisphaerales bacterium]|jgi:IS5 family transposase